MYALTFYSYNIMCWKSFIVLLKLNILRIFNSQKRVYKQNSINVLKTMKNNSSRGKWINCAHLKKIYCPGMVFQVQSNKYGNRNYKYYSIITYPHIEQIFNKIVFEQKEKTEKWKNFSRVG